MQSFSEHSKNELSITCVYIIHIYVIEYMFDISNTKIQSRLSFHNSI